MLLMILSRWAGPFIPLCCFPGQKRVCMLEDVFHYYCILSCIPNDCSLVLTFTNFSSCWAGLGSVLRCDVYPCFCCVVLHND